MSTTDKIMAMAVRYARAYMSFAEDECAKPSAQKSRRWCGMRSG